LPSSSATRCFGAKPQAFRRGRDDPASRSRRRELRRVEQGLLVTVARELSVSDGDALDVLLEPMPPDHLPEGLPRLLAGKRVRLRHDPRNLTRVVIELSPWHEKMICFAALVGGGER
jgi:hypothetical protein